MPKAKRYSLPDKLITNVPAVAFRSARYTNGGSFPGPKCALYRTLSKRYPGRYIRVLSHDVWLGAGKTVAEGYAEYAISCPTKLQGMHDTPPAKRKAVKVTLRKLREVTAEELEAWAVRVQEIEYGLV